MSEPPPDVASSFLFCSFVLSACVCSPEVTVTSFAPTPFVSPRGLFDTNHPRGFARLGCQTCRFYVMPTLVSRDVLVWELRRAILDMATGVKLQPGKSGKESKSLFAGGQSKVSVGENHYSYQTSLKLPCRACRRCDAALAQWAAQTGSAEWPPNPAL